MFVYQGFPAACLQPTPVSPEFNDLSDRRVSVACAGVGALVIVLCRLTVVIDNGYC